MSDFKDLFPNNWRPDDLRVGKEGDFPEPENRTQRPLNEREVKVVNVYEGVYESVGGSGQPAHSTTFVLLRDNKGREFRVFVLRDMAYAISLALDSDAPDRPFTHDLMKTMIERLGAAVERVTVDDLWQDTFYAKITLTRDGETMDIDARTSDAIAIALRFRAPIYVAEWIIESAQHDS